MHLQKALIVETFDDAYILHYNIIHFGLTNLADLPGFYRLKGYYF